MHLHLHVNEGVQQAARAILALLQFPRDSVSASGLSLGRKSQGTCPAPSGAAPHRPWVFPRFLMCASTLVHP